MTVSRSDVVALVPAAGLGVRLGRGPKALLSVAGRTLLEWAAAALGPHVCEVVVALPAGYRDVVLPSVDPSSGHPDAAHDESVTVRAIEGGSSRQATVLRLLEATSARYVIVHDAARPLTPSSVVRRVLDAAVVHGAATAGLPVSDTLHDVPADKPVSREGLVAIQTPQAFDRLPLLHAHRSAEARGLAFTDDAQLARVAGMHVEVVAGSAWSHKLTHPSDVAWLEALASTRDGAT